VISDNSKKAGGQMTKAQQELNQTKGGAAGDKMPLNASGAGQTQAIITPLSLINQ
jgi:hypothetical protein